MPAFPYSLLAAPQCGDKLGRKHYTLGLCILNSPSKVPSTLTLRHYTEMGAGRRARGPREFLDPSLDLRRSLSRDLVMRTC